MAKLSREEFDALEFDAAGTDDHRGAAERMSRLADSASQPGAGSDGTGSDSAGSDSAGPDGAMSRAEAYLRAGEQWLLADAAEVAADNFRRGIADGGESFVEGRIALARALFLLGEKDEARELIGGLEDVGRRDARLCDLVAELLVEQSDLIGALDWANTGVELCLAVGAPAGDHAAAGAETVVPPHVPEGADRNELRLLLSLRYRIRNDMGLAEDEYDKLLDDEF